MEVPLVLSERAKGRLVYSMPLAYRIAMAFILAILAFACFKDGLSPGIGGWIALSLTSLGLLYEESWAFDSVKREIRHRSGLLIAAHGARISMDDVEGFRVEAFVRGTVPGTEDERVENAAALEGGRSDDLGRRRARNKQPFLCLVCETKDGTRYFLNAVGARKGERLKAEGARIAAYCGQALKKS